MKFGGTRKVFRDGYAPGAEWSEDEAQNVVECGECK